MTRCRTPACPRVRDLVDVCAGGGVASGSSLFGKRYLVPALGVWLSPDPLAVHSPGSADLNLYAYVSGQLLRATDPTGLCADTGSPGPCGGANNGTGGAPAPPSTPAAPGGAEGADGGVGEGKVIALPQMDFVVGAKGAKGTTPMDTNYAYQHDKEAHAESSRRNAAPNPFVGKSEYLGEPGKIAAELVATEGVGTLLGAAMRGGKLLSLEARAAEAFTPSRRITLASGAGEDGASALAHVRTLEKGEKWADVQDFMRYEQWASGKEHYLISFKDGSRQIFSGGVNSTTFEFTDEMRKLILHTHPRATGASDFDRFALQKIGQRSSWVAEPGEPTVRFLREKPPPVEP